MVSFVSLTLNATIRSRLNRTVTKHFVVDTDYWIDRAFVGKVDINTDKDTREPRRKRMRCLDQISAKSSTGAASITPIIRQMLKLGTFIIIKPTR